MQPTFTRFNTAVHHTLEYYGIELIKDHFMFFAGTPTWRSKEQLESWYEFVLRTHAMMEDEINQVIITTNQNTQVYFFEWLKEWLNDPRISEISIGLILTEIEKYNENATTDFEEKIKDNAGEHALKTERWGHLEEYEEEVSIGGIARIFTGYNGPPFTIKEKRVNYRYYCANIIHEIIDATLIERYQPIIGGILRNFNNILYKYVQRYEQGKILPNTTLLITTGKDQDDERFLAEMEKPEGKKLNTNLSVPQLSYLFKMLLETKQISPKTNAELYRFISKNFITKGTQEKDISTDGLNNNFNKPENDTIKYWIEILGKMLVNSRHSL